MNVRNTCHRRDSHFRISGHCIRNPYRSPDSRNCHGGTTGTACYYYLSSSHQHGKRPRGGIDSVRVGLLNRGADLPQLGGVPTAELTVAIKFKRTGLTIRRIRAFGVFIQLPANGTIARYNLREAKLTNIAKLRFV